MYNPNPNGQNMREIPSYQPYQAYPSAQPGVLNPPERALSIVGGLGAVLFTALNRTPLSLPLRLLLLATGGYLAFRGATGHCYISEALAGSRNTRNNGQSQPKPLSQDDPHHPKATVIPAGSGINVSKNITINRPVSDVYGFWRNFENLPKIMQHLESVSILDDGRSHWVAKAPIGMTVAWDAEMISDEPNQRIAWRSLEGATVPNTGSVLFKEAYGGRGTEIRIELKYDPPGGGLGAAVAKLLGEEPSVQIQEDLYRFRQLMEAGEVATATGQTSGREKGKDLREQAAQNPTSIHSY